MGLSESVDFVAVSTCCAFFEMRVFLLFVVCPFVLCTVQEVERGRIHRNWAFGVRLSLLVSRTGTGDGGVFLLEPRASDLKPIKYKDKNPH